MFEKVIVTLILVLAAILVFSGCSAVENKAEQLEDEIESRLDPVEDVVESKVDAVEDAVEHRVDATEAGTEQLVADAQPADEVTEAADVVDAEITEALTNPAQDTIDKITGILGDVLKEQASAEAQADITAAEAKQIALDHAGLAADGVVFENIGLDYDNGIYHYDVEFRVGQLEYEYEIHAGTGEILSFEKDN